VSLVPTRRARGALAGALVALVAAPMTTRAEPPAAAAPAEVVADPPRQDDPAARAQRASRDAARQRHGGLAELPPVEALDDLVTIREDRDGRLVARIAALPPGAQPQMRIKVRRMEGAAFEMHLRGSFAPGNGRPALPVPALVRYDFGAAEASDDGVWQARLSAAEGYLNVSGQTLVGRLNVIQSGGRLNVTYRRHDNPQQQSFRAQVDSLKELRARFPREFEGLVVPLLSKFSDLPFLRPGPGDVYTVFNELPADDAVTRRVLDLLPQLAADAFAERDAASGALAALGPAGVLAVMRLDERRTGPLTVEQRHRLRTLVAAARRLPPQFDPAGARAEPRFLADCLEDPDAAVRAAAKRDLERALGRPVEFDVNLPPEARAEAAGKVRKNLPRPKVAETQPAPQAATRPELTN
jgi:hypothetical protein